MIEIARNRRRPLPAVLPPISAGRVEIEGRAKQIIETGRNRLVFGGVMFALAFLTICLRLVDLSVFEAAPHARQLARPLATERAAERADIVDRNGVVLATNLGVQSLYANPREVLDVDSAAKRLVAVLPELNENEVKARLKLDKAFVWLRRKLTPRQQAAVIRQGIPGLYFRREETRVYPHGRLAAHVVGLAGDDNVGLTGIERSFDEVLRESDEPLRLSLDVRVQQVVHESLSRAAKTFRATGGAAMVMAVDSGEIVAMVSLPDFDPNVFENVDPEAQFNRGTLGVYEMGSTFKLFTAAMALESGKATLRSSYDARRPIKVARFLISDYHAKNRVLTVPEILVYSSNIGAVRMALDVGTEGQRAFLDQLGMLQRSSLELPEIGDPLIPTPWREISTMTIAFGHGLSVSPVQLVSGISALVNGGIFYPATLLKRPSGTVPGRRVLSPTVSDQMRWLMRQVVVHGTGRKANSEMYPVGGKSGTAEKAGRGGYRKKSLLSSFVGAFPIDDPQYVVLVMLDDPQPTKETYGYATGGWVAAPTVKEIVERSGPLLGLPPVHVIDQDRDGRIVEASAQFGTFVKR